MENYFGGNIKGRRTLAKLTQQILAEGRPKSYMSKVEIRNSIH